IVLLAFTVLMLLAIGSAAMLASVWSRQTREAVIALYGIVLMLALLLWGAQELAAYLASSGAGSGLVVTSLAVLYRIATAFDPRFVLGPVLDGRHDAVEQGRRLLLALIAYGSLAVLCLSVSVWRLRRAFTRQLEGAGVIKKARESRSYRPADEEE